MRAAIIFWIGTCFSLALPAQEVITIDEYRFELTHQIGCTEIKDQQRTGTCWSFSTVSFLESEMMRMGKEAVDLSDMFSVRHIYMDKAIRYVRYHGKANFSEGSLGHDVIRVLQMHGMVPESVYDGKPEGVERYDHGELEKALKSYLDEVLLTSPLPIDWQEGVNDILDQFMGPIPETFEWEGTTYTSRTFADEIVQLNPDDYVSLTSFMHHPYYSSFVLEVPDNYSEQSFYNLPLEEFMLTATFALEHGYSLEWDGDVSDPGFNARAGLAIFPQQEWVNISDKDRKQIFRSPVPQRTVTGEMRQMAFDRHILTDDHLMHVVGLSKLPDNGQYFLIKNSWGTDAGKDGYIMGSDAWFRMNTISLLLHRDGVPRTVREKLGI